MFILFNLFEPLTDDFQYILTELGKDVLVNGNPAKALITSIKLKENNAVDDKYISTDIKIKAGDLVDYLNEKWLILSYYMGQAIRNKGIMRKCNHNIKFNFEGNIKEFPAIVESKVFDIEQDRYFSLPDGKIRVMLQNNPDTGNISIDQRFIKMGNAWIVRGVDKTREGIITLNCDLDSINQSDNTELEIANYGDYTFLVTINNTDPLTLTINDTLQLDISVLKNGIAIESPQLIYFSSNENVCTISETGLVTAVGVGVAEITVQLDNQYYQASDIISVNVQEQLQNNYSITIEGPDSIIFGSTENYTAIVYNNGVEVPEEIVSWSLSNDYATITQSDGNSCTVKAGDTTGVSVDLICTLDSDNTVTATKTIQITSLW